MERIMPYIPYVLGGLGVLYFLCCLYESYFGKADADEILCRYYAERAEIERNYQEEVEQSLKEKGTITLR